MHIWTQSQQSPRQVYEVWWTWDSVCKSYEGLCVLWRAEESRQSLRVCHGHTFYNLKNLITSFNPPWLKSKHTKFEAVSIKSVGGVRSNARCGKRQNGTNLHVQLKMADFLWTWRYEVHRAFCASGHDERVQRISSSYEKLSPTWRVFSESLGVATESLWSNFTNT